MTTLRVMTSGDIGYALSRSRESPHPGPLPASGESVSRASARFCDP